MRNWKLISTLILIPYILCITHCLSQRTEGTVIGNNDGGKPQFWYMPIEVIDRVLYISNNSNESTIELERGILVDIIDAKIISLFDKVIIDQRHSIPLDMILNKEGIYEFIYFKNGLIGTYKFSFSN